MREANRRLLKSLTITTLLQLQQMLPAESLIAQDLKRKTIEAQSEFVKTFGYENKGLIALMVAYGDPVVLMAKHAVGGKLAIKNSDLGRLGKLSSSGHSVDGRSALIDIEDRKKSSQSELSRPSNSVERSSREATDRLTGSKNYEVAVYGETDSYNDTRALVPFKGTQ